MRNGHRVLTRKPEENIPLGKARHRWEGHVKIGLKEKSCEVYGMNLTGSTTAICVEHDNKPRVS